MPVRVLVVDDEVSNHELVAEYLRGRGLEVNVARDGRQARALLGSVRYDLLITELKLPDCDGLELLRSASRRLPPVPGIVMTGYASVELVVRALRLRAYDFVLKPVRLKDLFALVEGAIARAAYDRDASVLARSLAFYEAAAMAEGPDAAAALAGQLVDTIGTLEGTQSVTLQRDGVLLAHLGHPAPDPAEWELPGGYTLAVNPMNARIEPLAAAATQALRRLGS